MWVNIGTIIGTKKQEVGEIRGVCSVPSSLGGPKAGEAFIDVTVAGMEEGSEEA